MLRVGTRESVFIALAFGILAFAGRLTESPALADDSMGGLSCRDERALFDPSAPSTPLAQGFELSNEPINFTGPHDPDGWCYKVQGICTLYPSECHVNTNSVISNVKGDPTLYVTGVGGGNCGWKTCLTPPFICGCGSRIVTSICE